MDLPNPISRTSAKDYQDYEFILNDIKHILELPPEEQLNRFRADPWNAFSGLRAPNGPDLPLSREGQKRFAQIANRGLKRLGTHAQLHRFEGVVQALKGEFSSLILGGFEMNADNAHEVFSSAVRRLEAGYLELTYYVPCSVVAERSYANFTIGPVTFILRDQFFKQNDAAIRQAAGEFDNSQFSEALLSRTHAFYSEFQWIASITVPACDPEISRRRAHAGIQKALDVFKLLIGGDRANHVKQGYDLAVPVRYAELVSSVPGSFSLRLGGKLQDAVTNDRWYDQVTADPGWQLFQSVLSNYWNAWGDLDEVQTRFLDALSWHSDAVSEPDLGAKIVKFWTAIERLLSTSRGSNISARAAVLCSGILERFEIDSQKLAELYQRRSDVVHGSANRADESWYTEAASASEEASKNTIFHYLYAIPQILSQRRATDRKKLQAWLTGLDNLASDFRRKLRSK